MARASGIIKEHHWVVVEDIDFPDSYWTTKKEAVKRAKEINDNSWFGRCEVMTGKKWWKEYYENKYFCR